MSPGAHDNTEPAQRGPASALVASPVDARAYLTEDVHAREQQAIFRRLWIFAGLKQLVAEKDAFLTRDIGGVPIVVQNFSGTLRAFENQCLHRRMALQWESFGHRPLVCKYHGWAYGNDLRVKGIPNAPYYELPDSCRDELRLREFPLCEVGNLLFINLDSDPLPIDQQFHAEFLTNLEKVSLHFDSEVAHACFDEAYNWKLNFENVLDHNHVQFLHSKSFFPMLHRRTDDTGAQVTLSPRIREIRTRLESTEKIDLRDLSYATHGPLDVHEPWFRREVERYGDIDDYYNWFIYPNVNFCSVHGQMFLIQQFVPKSPAITEYHLSVMTARRRNPRLQFAPLLVALINAEKKVIDEDAVALRQLQKKLHLDGNRCLHGVYESHIVRMLRWYADAVDPSDAR